MTKTNVTRAGYGAAAAGLVLYLITGQETGLILGGIFLCVTSLYRMVINKREKKNI